MSKIRHAQWKNLVHSNRFGRAEANYGLNTAVVLYEPAIIPKGDSVDSFIASGATQFDPGSHTVTATVQHSWQLDFWLRSQGSALTVLQPTQLRKKMIEELKSNLA